MTTAAGAHQIDLEIGYGSFGAAVGTGRRRRSVRAFRERFGDPAGWQRASLSAQLDAEPP